MQVKGETRSCINILDPAYGSTEYLEPGDEISQDEEAEFVKLLPEIARNSSVVTLSGSAPTGMSKDVYAQLVKLLKDQGKQVILDTSGELLKAGIAAGPTMIKPNQEELEMLFSTTIENLEDVIRCAKAIEGVDYVVVSLGADGALLVCEDGVFHGKPPSVQVVNTVGSGDSMVAALAVSLDRGYSPKKALGYGVAVATANALSPNTGDFEQDVLDRILKEVEVFTL